MYFLGFVTCQNVQYITIPPFRSQRKNCCKKGSFIMTEIYELCTVKHQTITWNNGINYYLLLFHSLPRWIQHISRFNDSRTLEADRDKLRVLMPADTYVNCRLWTERLAAEGQRWTGSFQAILKRLNIWPIHSCTRFVHKIKRFSCGTLLKLDYSQIIIIDRLLHTTLTKDIFCPGIFLRIHFTIEIKAWNTIHS